MCKKILMENNPIQYQNIKELELLQNNALQKLLHYLQGNSTFYKNHFATHQIKIDDIKSINDLQKIPFTTKEDVQKFNEDFICVSPEKIIDYVTTSGTQGNPVTIALTDNDLNRLAYNECNSFEITGGNKHEIYQLMATIDRRFMAGLAYFLGARKLGAGIVRVGNGLPELQWDTIKRVKPTAIICVPSFILKLIDYAETHGIDYKNTSINKAICIGEPIRNDDFTLNQLGKKINEKWPITLFSTYASSEMGAAFTECKCLNGGHLQPDLLIIEIINDQNKPAQIGEAGELVITTLGVEAMPLLRFKTGDICKVYNEPCACGRTTPRLGPVLGRKNQLIKYKGTTLYPGSFYDILDTVNEVLNYQVEVYTNAIGTDEIVVKIACTEHSKQIENTIKQHFSAKLRVTPIIQFEVLEALNKAVLPPLSRKPIKFIDKRSS